MMLTSAADTATYTHGRLSNGIAFLDVAERYVHVSDVDTCCVAVSFPVGSVHGEVDGLAHFLEHMLFLGNEAYPDPAAFGQFMRECSGYHNASTYPDVTVYIFSVPTAMAADLLLRLRHFFATPLFDQRSMASEVAVVQEEFNRMLSSESALESLALHHLCDNPSAPCARLKCGTTTSLLDGDVGPEMRRLFDLYRPQSMFIAVQHNGTLNVRDALAPFATLPSHPRGRGQEEYHVEATLPYAVNSHVLLTRKCAEGDQVSVVWHSTAQPESVSLLSFMENAMNKRCEGSLVASLVEDGIALDAFAFTTLLGPVVEFTVTATLPDSRSSSEPCLAVVSEIVHHVHRCFKGAGADQYADFVSRAREFKRVSCPMRGTERVSTLARNWWRVTDAHIDHMLLPFQLVPFSTAAHASVFRATFETGCVIVHRSRSASRGEDRTDPHTGAGFTRRLLEGGEVDRLGQAARRVEGASPYPFPEQTFRVLPRTPSVQLRSWSMALAGVRHVTRAADTVRFPNPYACAVVLKAFAYDEPDDPSRARVAGTRCEEVAIFSILMECVQHEMRTLMDECAELGATLNAHCAQTGVVVSCIGPPQVVVALLLGVFEMLGSFSERGIPRSTWSVCAARVGVACHERADSVTDCFNCVLQRFSSDWPDVTALLSAARACDQEGGRRAAGVLLSCAVRSHVLGSLCASRIAPVLKGRRGAAREPMPTFALQDGVTTSVSTTCRTPNVVIGYGWDLSSQDRQRVACAVLLQSWLSGWMFDDLRTEKSLCYACGASIARVSTMLRLTCVVQSHARESTFLVAETQASLATFLSKLPGKVDFFVSLRDSMASLLLRPHDTLRALFNETTAYVADGCYDFEWRKHVGEACRHVEWGTFTAFCREVLTRPGATTICHGAG